jgi:hypothetical protein
VSLRQIGLRGAFAATWLGAILALSLALRGAALAQDAPLDRNDFVIDVYTGPALGSSRMIGMGGAFAAAAAGIEGAPMNPATLAARQHWELDWFEWELAFGVLFPGAFDGDDLDNNGDDRFRYDGFVFAELGLAFHFGALGAGALGRTYSYGLGGGDGSTLVSLTVGHYGAGYALFDGGLLLGAGARTAAMDVSRSGTDTTYVGFAGTAPEVGAILAPHDWPVRLAASFRAALTSRLATGATPDDVQRVGGLVTPRAVHLPWELHLGVAWQVGPRPLNRPWVDPHAAEDAIEAPYAAARASRRIAQLRAEGNPDVRAEPRDPVWQARERARRALEDQDLAAEVAAAEAARRAEVARLPRRYVLLVADLIVTGPTRDGVGLEGFVSGLRQRSGERVVASVRLGAETEVWPDVLKVRLGSYFEPTRFSTSIGRAHLTGGFDLHVFDWDVFGLVRKTAWRVTGTFDIARAYTDWGVGVGVWH